MIYVHTGSSDVLGSWSAPPMISGSELSTTNFFAPMTRTTSSYQQLIVPIINSSTGSLVSGAYHLRIRTTTGSGAFVVAGIDSRWTVG